jgi:hypothetical protein
MKYLDGNLNNTIITLNYIFAFPIKKNCINNFNICYDIYEKRYFIYQRYLLVKSLFYNDIVNFLIIKML